MPTYNNSFSDLQMFQDVKHEPFIINGGTPAAVLIHGFPGTPAEMRPIAKILNDGGWTVSGILLPGMGSQIGTLYSTDYHQWISAAQSAIRSLKEMHKPLLVIGYSLGGAVAINAASQNNADGLVLLAPFWRIGNFSQNLLWQIYKRVTRTFQPFKKTSFDDPKTREFVYNLIPELDLNSDSVKQSLRDLQVPNRLIEQLESLGKQAKKTLPKIGVPLLLVQGIEDNRVSNSSSRKLIRDYKGKWRYLEVSAGHDLVSDGNKGWCDVSQAILDFATEIRSKVEQTDRSMS